MSALTRFDSFHVGDHAIFERTFAAADFAAFSRLSGDSNLLHHDERYAREHSPFGAPIVPLHLTLAPLSMVAGMIFPGEPSLYLGHQVTAAKAVKYGDRLRYSARVAAINHSHRILTIRVLALRETDVVLDATMRVQARTEQWESGSALVRKAGPGRAFVTGASGEIGGAIAVALARAGWRLLLQDRGAAAPRQRLVERLGAAAADVRFVAADLAGDVGPVLDAVRDTDDLELVVHAASPGVDAPVGQLVAVNFSFLKQLADAALPGLLARQQGAIALIGTAAVRASLPGWEAYSGAKAMAMNLIDSIDRRFAGFGIRAYTLAPGYVATRFSAAYRLASDAALLPGEVAEALVTLVREPERHGNTLFLEPGRAVRGQLTFQDGLAPSATLRGPAVSADDPAPVLTGDPSPKGARSSDGITQAIRSVLRVPSTHDLSGGGLGLTPGWDSLKHIEIILAIEARTGLHFRSTEIEATHQFDDLVALCTRKIQDGPPSR